MSKTEVWYCWMERATVEGDDKPRLLIPRANPREWEHPFDLLFATPEEAELGLKNWDIPPEESNRWILVKKVLEPVDRPSGTVYHTEFLIRNDEGKVLFGHSSTVFMQTGQPVGSAMNFQFDCEGEFASLTRSFDGKIVESDNLFACYERVTDAFLEELATWAMRAKK